MLEGTVLVNEKINKKTMVYTMTPEVAQLFYQIAGEFHLDTEEERASLLAHLASEGLMTSVSATNRSKSEIVADYRKHFEVLDLTEGEDATDITPN